MSKINKLVVLSIFSVSTITVSALEVSIPPFLSDKVSISIHQVNNKPTPVYTYRDNVPMLIASNMKLVTSYVALQSLGNSFQWKTKLAYDGKIIDHQLIGNLYLIGSGDPTITTDTLYSMLESANNLGITKITGNVIVDDSIFNSNVTSSELHPEPLASYSVNPNGFIVNSNLSNLTITIKNNKINLIPDFKQKYTIINQLKLSQQAANCKDTSNYFSASMTNNKTVLITGQIPKSCKNKQLALYLLDNHTYNTNILKKVIKNQNITLDGKITFEHVQNKNELNIITTNNSPELSSIITDMNLQSNNLYAKTLFLSVGAYKTTNKNTFSDSHQYYLSSLASTFDFNELSSGLENGSGLSRTEKMTTAHMNQLLDSMYNSTNNKLILSSLPTPGKDGTLEKEFPAFANKFYAKTGSLSDTKAYSGYFIASNGNVYSLSLVANNINQDQLQSFKQLTNNILNQLNK